MTVLLFFVLIVLNCSMVRYNGRLHCIVGVLPTCYKRKAASYFYPPGGTGPLDSGILETPRKISDHEATYVILAHNYALSSSFKRSIWLYKHADFNKLHTKITSFDWKCLLDGTTNEACLIFKEFFLKFVKECIPNEEVIIRPDDKPWYDSEIPVNVIDRNLKL